jgi:protein phosphatase 1 regulatory subunit 7
VLDVGDNKIRTIENIGHLTNLTQFYAAKNKLTSLKGLEKLTKLELVAC